MSQFDLPGAKPAGDPDNDDDQLDNSAEDIDLTGLSMMGLLALRNRVQALLPAVHLKDMDLSQELVLQVAALQELQRLTMGDKNTPANQQAQVANSLSAALVNLVKLQSEVQTTERFKRVERALINFLNGLPEGEDRAHAYALYEAAIQGVELDA